MPTCMTWAFTIAFKAVFEILAIFLTLKTIANAIFFNMSQQRYANFSYCGNTLYYNQIT